MNNNDTSGYPKSGADKNPMKQKINPAPYAISLTDSLGLLTIVTLYKPSNAPRKLSPQNETGYSETGRVGKLSFRGYGLPRVSGSPPSVRRIEAATFCLFECSFRAGRRC
jgi:hypothetical protein